MFFHPTPLFKAYLLAQRQAQDEYERDASCKDVQGNPCKCPKCNSYALDEKVTDTMDGLVMEYEVVCRECLTHVAYWAHGYFQQDYPPEYSEFFTSP